ncbi:hypothetical protein D3C81_1951060 [compost metagenome]
MQLGNEASQLGPQGLRAFLLVQELAQRLAGQWCIVDRITLDAGDAVHADHFGAGNPQLSQSLGIVRKAPGVRVEQC